MSKGVKLIAAERKRQIEKEGYSEEHDSRHDMNELTDAASCYLFAFSPNAGRPMTWPWEKKSWKPSDRVRNLVKAGALIAAEIDRITKESSQKRS